MLNKDDKDGIIEFLKERIRKVMELSYGYDTEIRELCEKTLAEVTF